MQLGPKDIQVVTEKSFFSDQPHVMWHGSELCALFQNILSNAKGDSYLPRRDKTNTVEYM